MRKYTTTKTIVEVKIHRDDSGIFSINFTNARIVQKRFYVTENPNDAAERKNTLCWSVYNMERGVILTMWETHDDDGKLLSTSTGNTPEEIESFYV